MKGEREGTVTHSRFESVSRLAGLFHLVLSFLTSSPGERPDPWRSRVSPASPVGS